METPPLDEWYRASRRRVAALVDASAADRPVPATPAWTVHDVVSHLAGVAEDVRTGNLAGVATDPWTAAQVERGRSKTMAQLLEQWETDAPALEALLAAHGAAVGRAVIDALTHEADLCGALGLAIDLPSDAVAWAADALRVGFAEAVAAAGLPAVSVDAPDIEVLRGRMGRRTEAEVAGYAWSADPAPYLDPWFVFGRAERSLGE